MGTWSFPGVKYGLRPERAADHSLPSSAAVFEESSYKSTHPLGHNRACNGNILPLPLPFVKYLLFFDGVETCYYNIYSENPLVLKLKFF